MEVMTPPAAPAGNDPLRVSRSSRLLVALVRIGVALLWVQNLSWKNPPTFGRGAQPSGLYQFTRWAVEFPVFPPYRWLVEDVVLPNFTVFAWLVFTVEAALGAFLLVGLAARWWALVGVVQTLAISLSVLNAPHEWHWTYLMMLLLHVALFATAAGRYAGLDGVLRPRWQRHGGRLARLLVRAS
jgi:thiosulfate dehydrogenase [quinone] large subunit